MGTGVFETYSLQPGGRAADIPGGPGTSASLNLDLPFASVFETASDIDWFRFEAEAGATYRFEIDGDPASSDPVEDQGLALYASDGTLLVEKDRRPNLDYPGRLPGPTSITYAPEADGPLFIGAQAAGAAGGYALSATRTDDIPDNASTRETLAVGGTVYGVSSPVYDEDWYPVALEGGRTYVFTLDGDDVATDPLHPWLQLYADDGALIDAAAFEALAFGPTAEPLAGLTYRPKDDETVFVSAAGTPVLDASGAASQDYVGTYALRVGLSDDILDNAETEGRIAVGETVKGRADYPWDEDWYLMAAKKRNCLRDRSDGQSRDSGGFERLLFRGGLERHRLLRRRGRRKLGARVRYAGVTRRQHGGDHGGII